MCDTLGMGSRFEKFPSDLIGCHLSKGCSLYPQFYVSFLDTGFGGRCHGAKVRRSPSLHRCLHAMARFLFHSAQEPVLVPDQLGIGTGRGWSE